MKIARADGGQSLVEIALMLPIFVFTLIGGADLARAYALQLAVQNGARAGAESYAIDASPTALEAKLVVFSEMDRTPGMDASQALVAVTKAQSDGTACLTPPSIPSPCFVTVRVQYTFRTTTPWPLIPNTANFDRTTTMRTFY